MKQIIFLLLCSALTITFGEEPIWYPENSAEIWRKCFEENLQSDVAALSPTKEQAEQSMKMSYFCYAKEANFYDEENGIYVDRLKYFFKSLSKAKCETSLVQDCADENKEVVPTVDMVFKVMKCMEYRESELIKNGC